MVKMRQPFPKKIKEYLKHRNETQPLKKFTCGCIFKNYHSQRLSCRAGLAIDIMGHGGIEIGGVKVSNLHANFMENVNGASLPDVESLNRFHSRGVGTAIGYKI